MIHLDKTCLFVDCRAGRVPVWQGPLYCWPKQRYPYHEGRTWPWLWWQCQTRIRNNVSERHCYTHVLFQFAGLYENLDHWKLLKRHKIGHRICEQITQVWIEITEGGRDWHLFIEKLRNWAIWLCHNLSPLVTAQLWAVLISARKLITSPRKVSSSSSTLKPQKASPWRSTKMHRWVQSSKLLLLLIYREYRLYRQES